MGPTASGKTGVAEALARELDAFLINADAFQVYRGMDVGTAKPVERSRYELIDIKDPNEGLALGQWAKLAQHILEDSFLRGRNVIVVGGTGLYVRALFEEYAAMAGPPDQGLRKRLNETSIDTLRKRLVTDHPEIAGQTDMANPVRVRRAIEKLHLEKSPAITLPPYKKLKVALNPAVDVLDGRIARRVVEMLHNGWIQEVEQLRQLGYRRDDPGFKAIGYRTVWDHIERKISLEEAAATTIAETRRYAKRQRTWLRTEPNLVELSATTENDTVLHAMERIESVLM
jgi:tRNA dimethylallyltransferase